MKNDVIAILSKKVNSISARNGQSRFPVGPDEQCEVGNLSGLPCEVTVFPQMSTLVKPQLWKKFVYPKIRSHFS